MPAAPSSAPADAPVRVGTAVDDVNDAFHDGYDRARSGAEDEAPVFVVATDALTVFRNGQPHVVPITPRSFHVIKSVAHAPVAVYAALVRRRGAEDEPKALHALREHVACALASLDAENDLDADTLANLRAILAATMELAERAAAKSVEANTLDAFARALGPRMLDLTNAATRIQLKALDDAVNDAVAELGEEERDALQVVVTGDHQARARSLGMQYFRKRFREPEGAEERVTYAEGVSDPEEALALVGKRRLDNAIALAFFGDAKRLQRDILGDAAKALLASTELARIG